jgi:translation elongation factor EF-Tu-like GTPase
MTMKCTVRWATVLVCILALPLVGGCAPSGDLAPGNATPTAAATRTVRIAVLGDKSQLALIDRITKALPPESLKRDDANAAIETTIDNTQLVIRTHVGDAVASSAADCVAADVALLAVDARDGPMPIHREHLILARQMHVPSIVVVLVHAMEIDDPDLLELEELEIRELLTKYGWDGDNANICFDAERRARSESVRAISGPKGILRCLTKFTARPATPMFVEARSISAEVYALAEKEAFPLKTKGIISGHHTLVIGSEAVEGEISKSIKPGNTSDIVVDTPKSIRAFRGQRFVILEADHVLATGVITSIRE